MDIPTKYQIHILKHCDKHSLKYYITCIPTQYMTHIPHTVRKIISHIVQPLLKCIETSLNIDNLVFTRYSHIILIFLHSKDTCIIYTFSYGLDTLTIYKFSHIQILSYNINILKYLRQCCIVVELSQCICTVILYKFTNLINITKLQSHISLALTNILKLRFSIHNKTLQRHLQFMNTTKYYEHNIDTYTLFIVNKV